MHINCILNQIHENRKGPRAMMLLKLLVAIIIWPGNRFCEAVGQDPADDNGMLRGFVNNIAWGVPAVALIWYLIGP